MKKSTALISVYHKEGIVEFALALIALGFEIISSGGTATHLKNAGVLVRDVSELVGGGAILGHRVVTLSREVHAGLLATESDADIAELEKLNIPRLDLVCNDLYRQAEQNHVSNNLPITKEMWEKLKAVTSCRILFSLNSTLVMRSKSRSAKLKTHYKQAGTATIKSANRSNCWRYLFMYSCFFCFYALAFVHK